MTGCAHGYNRRQDCASCSHTDQHRSIGGAILSLKNGKRVKRASWRDAWLALVKQQTGLGWATGINRGTEFHTSSDIIAISTPDGMASPWSPTHEDLLATDWKEAT